MAMYLSSPAFTLPCLSDQNSLSHEADFHLYKNEKCVAELRVLGEEQVAVAQGEELWMFVNQCSVKITHQKVRQIQN